MLSFTEFVRMKALDLSGKDIKKTEHAAVRAIVECIKENERWIISVDRKKLIEEFLKRIMKNGNIARSKEDKKQKLDNESSE